MKYKIILFSYTKLTQFIKKTRICKREDVEITIIDAIFQEALIKAREFDESGEVDCFIASGGNAFNLRNINLSTPVVEIKISGLDIISSIKKAKDLSKKKVVLVNFTNPMEDLAPLGEIIKLGFKQISFTSEDDARATMLKWKDKESTIIIGSSLACEIAEDMGLANLFVYSQSALESAVRQAVQIAKSRYKAISKSKHLQTILDFAYSGIIGIDKRGTITVFNPEAEKILKTSAQDVIGKKIHEHFSGNHVNRIIGNYQTQKEMILEIKGVKVIATQIPVLVKNELEGTVLTFHDFHNIQKTERKIRKSLHQKGLVAHSQFSHIIGKSRKIRRIIEMAKKYAMEEHTILLMGETGCGKEILAQSIHNYSLRKEEAFVVVNCAALSENLLESELFGYEGGAFTGAKRDGKMGLFELAHRGTIFLDEVSEVSPKIQARLLRVIEEKEVMRVGGERIIPVDIRIIAATNRPLSEMVNKGEFRDDLYFRLNVLHLLLPPLRERKSDIPLLVKHFIQKLDPEVISLPLFQENYPTILEYFQNYNWPGNLRELQNILTRMVVLLKNRSNMEEVQMEDLLLDIQTAYNNGRDKQIDKGLILTILSEVNGNKSKAANRLGISRMTLYRKIKEFGITL